MIHLRPSPPSVASRSRGFSTLEVLAASAVTAAALAAVTPLFMQHTRLMAEARRERIAIEDLANQAERLAAVPADGLDHHLASLAVSPMADGLLPDAHLDAVRGDSPVGPTVTFRLRWNSPGRLDHPLRLVTWLPNPGKGRGGSP